MSEMKNGRKKHIVSGKVEEVKRTQRSIGRSVSGGSSFLNAVRRFFKGGKK